MRIFFATLCVFLLGAEPARAQAIGVYADEQGFGVQINAPLYTPTTFYIVARGGNAFNPPGVQGAEFAVEHDITPTQAIFSVLPSPASTLALGDPMNGGCNIGFPTCQAGYSVLLYTGQITVLDANAMMNRTLSVVKHSTPSNVNFDCPLLNKCDVPVYTAMCVLGDFTCINDFAGICVFAVESSTWSEVKQLYAN